MGEDPSLVVASDAIEHIEVTVRFQSFYCLHHSNRLRRRVRGGHVGETAPPMNP
jgi:hypothetical protein